MKLKSTIRKYSKYIFPVLLMMATSFLTLFSQINSPKGKQRLIYNNDGTDILGNFMYNSRPISIQDVYNYVDVVANTPVTTYMICSGSPLYYGSKFDNTFAAPIKDLMYDCETDTSFLKAVTQYNNTIKKLASQGTDIIKLCLERAKKNHLEAFITMRMNDLHFSDTSLKCLRAQSEFWRNHPEYWVGDYPGWHAYGALNFAVKEVREYKLNLVRELCEKYDFDGLDLDFMRFIIYFPFEQGPKYLDVMTDFVKDIKQIIDNKSKRSGKHILLSARVPTTFKLCIEKGLDIKKWAELRLFDFFTIGAHWTCDPDIPVKEFKKDLGDENIPVYVSIDDGQYYLREFRSDGIYRGIASNYYSQGADGLYLFNYFFTEEVITRKDPLKPKDGQVTRAIRNPDFLNEFGNKNALLGRNKIYTIADGITEYGFRPNTTLPKLISPWDQEKIFMNIPEDIKVNRPQSALLFIRVSKGANLKVYLNKNQLNKADTSNIYKFGRGANLVPEEEVQVYSVPVESIINGYNRLDFRSDEPKPRLLRRIEVAVIFGDVEKCGYF